MGANIHIDPRNIWALYQRDYERLRNELVEVANNEETEHFIYVTVEGVALVFSVFKGDKEIRTEPALTRGECECLAAMLFSDYLFPVDETDDEVLKDEISEVLQDTQGGLDEAAEEREDELYWATADFLVALLGLEDMDELISIHGEEIITETLEESCWTLMETRGISVQRPIVWEEGLE